MLRLIAVRRLEADVTLTGCKCRTLCSFQRKKPLSFWLKWWSTLTCSALALFLLSPVDAQVRLIRLGGRRVRFGHVGFQEALRQRRDEVRAE